MRLLAPPRAAEGGSLDGAAGAGAWLIALQGAAPSSPHPLRIGELLSRIPANGVVGDTIFDTAVGKSYSSRLVICISFHRNKHLFRVKSPAYFLFPELRFHTLCPFS